MLAPTLASEWHGSGNSPVKTRILIVDDHPMVRAGLIRLLAQQTDLTTCAEAGTAAEAEAAVADTTPDLVILDLRLRCGDGFELLNTLKKRFPALPILVLSQYEAPLYVERALRAGALGYLQKDQAAEQVLAAIRTVLAGQIFLSRGTASLLLQKLARPVSRDLGSPVEGLTERELRVYQLLGSGMGTRDIAEHLKLSFKTIETYRENIKRKLGLRSATQLVHHATEWAKEGLALPRHAFRRGTKNSP